MPVIVDTYNVLHVTGVLPPHLAGIDVVGLADLIGLSRYADQNVWLVCDGRPGPSRPELRGRIVTHYAGAGNEADDHIGRMIDASTTPKRLTVVSSDRRVAAMARRRRCHHRSAEAFLAELAADADRAGERMRRGNRRVGGRPPVPLDRAIVERWVALFALGSDHLELPRSTLARVEAEQEPSASTEDAGGIEISPTTKPPTTPTAKPTTRKEARRLTRAASAGEGAAARRPNAVRNAAPGPTDPRHNEAGRVLAELERELPPELLGELRRLGKGREAFGGKKQAAARVDPSTPTAAPQRDRRGGGGRSDERNVAGRDELERRGGTLSSFDRGSLARESFDLEAFDFEAVMQAALELNPPTNKRKDDGDETPPSHRRTRTTVEKQGKLAASSARSEGASGAKSGGKPSPKPGAKSTRKGARGRKGRRP